MTREDHRLLNEVIAALGEAPFAPVVRVCGVFMSRGMARALERQMLRIRSSEQRSVLGGHGRKKEIARYPGISGGSDASGAGKEIAL